MRALPDGTRLCVSPWQLWVLGKEIPLPPPSPSIGYSLCSDSSRRKGKKKKKPQKPQTHTVKGSSSQMHPGPCRPFPGGWPPLGLGAAQTRGGWQEGRRAAQLILFFASPCMMGQKFSFEADIGAHCDLTSWCPLPYLKLASSPTCPPSSSPPGPFVKKRKFCSELDWPERWLVLPNTLSGW